MLYEPLNFDFEKIRSQRISSVLGRSVIKNSDLSISYEEIIFKNNQFSLSISVNNDTDELILKMIEENQTQIDDISKWEPVEVVSGFLGSELGWCWIGRNYLGYADMFILSFSGIDPQVIIYGMASMLNIYTIEKR